MTDFTKEYCRLYAPRGDGTVTAQHLRVLGKETTLPELPVILLHVWREFWEARMIWGALTAQTLMQACGALPLPFSAMGRLFVTMEFLLSGDEDGS